MFTQPERPPGYMSGEKNNNNKETGESGTWPGLHTHSVSPFINSCSFWLLVQHGVLISHRSTLAWILTLQSDQASFLAVTIQTTYGLFNVCVLVMHYHETCSVVCETWNMLNPLTVFILWAYLIIVCRPFLKLNFLYKFSQNI